MRLRLMLVEAVTVMDSLRGVYPAFEMDRLNVPATVAKVAAPLASVVFTESPRATDAPCNLVDVAEYDVVTMTVLVGGGAAPETLIDADGVYTSVNNRLWWGFEPCAVIIRASEPADTPVICQVAVFVPGFIVPKLIVGVPMLKCPF